MILQAVGCPGKVHDYQLFKRHLDGFSAEICFIADSGYQGLMKLFPHSFTPFKNYVKNPLTNDQRSCNQYYASIRVTVEHKIRSIKIFRLFSTTYRSHTNRLQQQFMLAAGIRNLELLINKT